MIAKQEMDKAVAVLRSGGVILCPSDTIASLSCDACNATAILKIFDIKQRPPQKSMIMLVSSITMLEAYVAHIPEAAYQIIEVSDTPTTIVYPNPRNLPKELLAEDGSLGIRVVNIGFIKSIIDRFRKPIVSTSANLSGKPAPIRVSETELLISQSVDMVIDLDEFLTKPSSIIKFNSDDSFRIIRK